MTKAWLIATIGAAVAVVAALAVLTPTVIVDDNDGPHVGITATALPLPPRLGPVPGDPQGLPPLRRQGPLRDLRGCLQQHGLGEPNRGKPPDLRAMRDALRACRGTLPGSPFGR